MKMHGTELSSGGFSGSPAIEVVVLAAFFLVFDEMTLFIFLPAPAPAGIVPFDPFPWGRLVICSKK
jgi:hypothetical protein